MAFGGCSALTSVTIGHSVSNIETYAFSWCTKLEEVYCFAEKVPSTIYDAFAYSNHKNATLYVPASALEDYKTTKPWSEFKFILPLPDGTAIENTSKQKAEETERYTLNGIKKNGTRKGLNIIRMSDGTVKKVMRK